MYWSHFARLKVLPGGNLPLARLREILEYDANYNMRGFGQDARGSGLREISEEQFQQIYREM